MGIGKKALKKTNLENFKREGGKLKVWFGVVGRGISKKTPGGTKKTGDKKKKGFFSPGLHFYPGGTFGGKSLPPPKNPPPYAVGNFRQKKKEIKL